MFSVVVPMYNSEKTIGNAIESVVNQSRSDLIDEIIIIDDGSNDNSVDVVREYASKYKSIKLFLKKNGGASSARNMGIEKAKNNMIALLDSDDEWTLNKIEIQYNYLKNNPQIRALGSNRIGESISMGTRYEKGIRRISPISYCIKMFYK